MGSSRRHHPAKPRSDKPRRRRRLLEGKRDGEDRHSEGEGVEDGVEAGMGDRERRLRKHGALGHVVRDDWVSRKGCRGIGVEAPAMGDASSPTTACTDRLRLGARSSTGG